MGQIFLDGDFPSGMGNCKFHCSPTCHPGQVGPEWKYGCTHPAWPANKYGGFVPLVDCGGDKSKCELKGKKFVSHYLRGKRLSLKYALQKVERLKNEIEEVTKLVKDK
jgi:hypothetical protein